VRSSLISSSSIEMEFARRGGYAGYTVLEYSEGIESTLPVAQRVAQGVVRLER
jgi:hypothetical protein